MKDTRSTVQIACETYTAVEVARILGVSKQTIYNAIESGEIPNAGVCDTIRIPKQWVTARLRAECTPSN